MGWYLTKAWRVAILLVVGGSIPVVANDPRIPKERSASPSRKITSDDRSRGHVVREEKSLEPIAVRELFSAMNTGDIEVQYIGRDATQGTIIVQNKTDKPIDLQMPEIFGAMPVLAQGLGGPGGGAPGGLAPGGGLGNGFQGAGGAGGGQTVGGGFGGGNVAGGGGNAGFVGNGVLGNGPGNGQGGGGGFNGGFFRVAPDRARKINVTTVCLEHGKPDPNPRMAYRLVPLSVVNKSPEIEELCKALGNTSISQNVAQAAAWNLANGLTWHELLEKPRVVSEYTATEYFFSQFEIQNAMRITHTIQRVIQESEQAASPGHASLSKSNP